MNDQKLSRIRRASALAIVAVAVLASCRGGDGTEGVDPELVDFIETPDPDRFLQFLNRRPGETADAVDGINNFTDFPVAYYNTIDPQSTRTTFDDWKLENGFLIATEQGLVAPACDAVSNCCVPQIPVTAQCEVVSTNVRFRDTKDLGYGRDMFLRHTLQGESAGQVSIFVRNFAVDSIEGLPYGPLNLEALIREESQLQFGVNAIEFSTYPYGVGEPSNGVALNLPDCVADPTSVACQALQTRKFAKFYNFAGDGRVDAGAIQTEVDLDTRSTLPMPSACITCHGGRGGTVVSSNADGTLGLEPTLHNELPGDLQAHLQTIEVDTLQFSSAVGFRRQDNIAGLRLINEAVLASYREHQTNVAARDSGSANSGYWNPEQAISLLEGRLLAADGFDATHVPVGWQTEPDELFINFVGPHCQTCHVLQGSYANPSLAFGTSNTFQSYSERIEHLVFEDGLMPLGLWNYREFWDFKEPLPVVDFLGLNRVENGELIKPGRPVARIAAPLVESPGVSSILINGNGSAFADTYEWEVSPADATIEGSGARVELRLPQSPASEYTVTLRASNGQFECVAGSGDRCEQSVNIALTEATALDASLCGASGVNNLLQNSCQTCHNPQTPLIKAIPVVFANACVGTESDEVNYRNLLTRVDLDNPLDSLLLRKPLNGATRVTAEEFSTSTIEGYHAGALRFFGSSGQRDISTLINWINHGAPVDSTQ